MDSVVEVNHAEAALLSAATPPQSEIVEPPSLLKLAGESLIAYQMRALSRTGIRDFFIEVDQVSGALLALCDNARKAGLNIEFVRSTQELSAKLPASQTLLVQSEAIFADDALLGQILSPAAPFILTVDGRDENGAFERMDLNTRWAGLARVDASVVRAVANLPPGWSIASSLLRQAIQQRIPQKKLAQSKLQQHHLMLVATPDAAEDLTTTLLSKRAETVGGIVESKLFAPIAARLAKPFWRNNINKAIVPAATLALAAGSAVLGFLDLAAGGAVAALFSIFGLTLSTTLYDPAKGGFSGKLLAPATWVLLAAALIGAVTRDTVTATDNMFAAVALIGLLIHARQIALPDWARNMLISLALMAIALLGFAAANLVVPGVKILVLLHIAILVFVGFRGGPGHQGDNQP